MDKVLLYFLPFENKQGSSSDSYVIVKNKRTQINFKFKLTQKFNGLKQTITTGRIVIPCITLDFTRSQ